MTKPNEICPVCGKEFYIKPYRREKTEHPTCSRECAHVLLKKRIMKTCIVCGKEFETRDNIYRRDAKYCSQECFHKHNVGEEHGMYKHGCGKRGTPEQQRERGLKFYNNHWKERYEKGRRKRLEINKTEGTHTIEEWENLLKEHDYICYYCGCKLKTERNYRGKDKATRDHKIPITRGGTDNIDNIFPSCRSCNSSKGNMTEEEFKEYLNRINSN